MPDPFAIAIMVVALLAWDGWRRQLALRAVKHAEDIEQRLGDVERLTADIVARGSQRQAVSQIGQSRQRIGR